MGLRAMYVRGVLVTVAVAMASAAILVGCGPTEGDSPAPTQRVELPTANNDGEITWVTDDPDNPEVTVTLIFGGTGMVEGLWGVPPDQSFGSCHPDLGDSYTGTVEWKVLVSGSVNLSANGNFWTLHPIGPESDPWAKVGYDPCGSSEAGLVHLVAVPA